MRKIILLMFVLLVAAFPVNAVSDFSLTPGEYIYNDGVVSISYSSTNAHTISITDSENTWNKSGVSGSNSFTFPTDFSGASISETGTYTINFIESETIVDSKTFVVREAPLVTCVAASDFHYSLDLWYGVSPTNQINDFVSNINNEYWFPSPDAVFMVGDLVYDPNDIDDFKTLVDNLNVDYYTMPGNHDNGEDDPGYGETSGQKGKLYYDSFGELYNYKVSINGIDFICTGSDQDYEPLVGTFEESLGNANNLNWFNNTVTDSNTTIVFNHFTFDEQRDAGGLTDHWEGDWDNLPYSTNHNSTTALNIQSVFEDHDVELAIGGHGHMVTKTEKNGVTYAMDGSMQQSPYNFRYIEVYADRIEVHTINKNSNPYNEYILDPHVDSVHATSNDYFLGLDSESDFTVYTDTSTPEPYFIKDNLDFLISDSINTEETKTYYLIPEAGYRPDGGAVLPVYDLFDDGIISSTLWPTQYGGTWAESNGIIYTTSGSSFTCLKSSYSESLNYTVKGKVRILDEGTYYMGFNTRLLDSANYNGFYLSGFDHLTEGNVYWKRRVADSWALVDETDWPVDANWHDVELKKEGDMHYFYVDDVLKISGPDTSLENANFGLFTWGTHTGDIERVYLQEHAANEPTVEVTDLGPYYKINVTNDGAATLSDYQFVIDGEDLGIYSKSESWNLTTVEPLYLLNTNDPASIQLYITQNGNPLTSAVANDEDYTGGFMNEYGSKTLTPNYNENKIYPVSVTGNLGDGFILQITADGAEVSAVPLTINNLVEARNYDIYLDNQFIERIGEVSSYTYTFNSFSTHTLKVEYVDGSSDSNTGSTTASGVIETTGSTEGTTPQTNDSDKTVTVQIDSNWWKLLLLACLLGIIREGSRKEGNGLIIVVAIIGIATSAYKLGFIH